MNYIRDNHVEAKPINWEFYKIFVNIDKNRLPELTKYLQEHSKSEWNNYFKNAFESAFISFNSQLCGKI
jgi:uncharacterized protein YijF (DUF1287 family)